MEISKSTHPHEPFVYLAPETAFKGWSHEDLVFHNQQMRQTEKYRFYQLAFDYLANSGVVGDYYEFGVHRVRTFRMALTEARRHMLDTMHFYAFDSFQGMPPNSGPEMWKEGSLCTSEAEFCRIVMEHGIAIDRIHTVPGFYKDSLHCARQEELIQSGRKAAFVTVDCDLYVSAVPVFSFIDPFLQEGSVLYIDDWFAGYRGDPFSGVRHAFQEYRYRDTVWKFEEHMAVGWWGKSFLVVR